MNGSTRRHQRRRLLALSIHGQGRRLAELVAWSLVQALPAFLTGRLVARAMDEGFLAHRSGVGFTWLALLAASVVVGAWGTRQTYLRLAGLVEPFRDRLVELVVSGALRRSAAASSPSDTGSVARLTQHVEILREAYGGVLMTLQSFAVGAVSALLGLFGLLPAALLLVVPPLLLGVLIFLGTLGGMAARQRASILADEGISATTAALVGGLRDVEACGGEDTVYATVSAHIDAQARATRELARYTAVRTGAVAVGGWLPVILLLVGGPWLVRNGASTGELLGALTYVLYGVHPALQTLVRELGGAGLWLFVTLDRVLEATDGSVGDTREPAAGAAGMAPSGYDVRLHGVTFRYGASPEPVIRELDLVIPEGDHLAIVGPSGVGKSTLAGLLAGLLQPDAGEVSIGGVPIREIDGPALALRRTLIPQEAYVFGGTVRENLTYLRQNVGTAELDEAVDLLGARPLVDRLGGYHTDMDASSLSSGERQLLTLVRSYLSPAPLVVLDEATCHLDPEAEAEVERAFAERPGTLVVIAHRISSAMRARRILVLDGTEILTGTHGELVGGSRLYSDLVGHWG